MKVNLLDLGDNNYLNSSSIYENITNEEQITSEFINNKRVYSRRFSHQFQSATSCVFAHNLDLTKIEIVRFNAYCVNAAGTLYFTLPCSRVNSGTDTWLDFYIDTNNFVIYSGGMDRSSFTSYITIYYIKK